MLVHVEVETTIKTDMSGKGLRDQSLISLVVSVDVKHHVYLKTSGTG